MYSVYSERRKIKDSYQVFDVMYVHLNRTEIYSSDVLFFFLSFSSVIPPRPLPLDPEIVIVTGGECIKWGSIVGTFEIASAATVLFVDGRNCCCFESASRVCSSNDNFWR